MFRGTFDFDSKPFDWGAGYKRPNIPLKDLVIAELPVRLFTGALVPWLTGGMHCCCCTARWTAARRASGTWHRLQASALPAFVFWAVLGLEWVCIETLGLVHAGQSMLS